MLIIKKYAIYSVLSLFSADSFLRLQGRFPQEIAEFRRPEEVFMITVHF